MLFFPKRTGSNERDESQCMLAHRKAMPLSYICGFERPETFPKRPEMGRYGYLFFGAPAAPQVVDMSDRLQSVIKALRTQIPAPCAACGGLTPALPLMAGFLDHDISATPETPGALYTSPNARTAAPRTQVTAMLGNLRSSVLNLESVYGGGPVQGPLARKLQASLRRPGNPAELWAGSLDAPNHILTLSYDPRDTARDVLRLEGLLRAKEAQISTADLRSLPQPLRDVFFHADGAIRHKHAVIGDLRNDESVALSHCHLAFVRLHNRFVEHADESPDAPSAALPEARFRWAKKMTRWHYQWLILNAFLPAICDPHTLASVKMRGPSIYARFLMNWRTPHPNLLPLPLEFSAAALPVAKLRASQIDPEDYTDLQSLFVTSGRAVSPLDRLPQSVRPPAQAPQAPEWTRFVHRPPCSLESTPRTCAEPRHTKEQAAAGLGHPAAKEALSHLARGHRLNLPTGQACLESLQLVDEITLPRLSPEDLRSGRTGSAIADAGFDHDTPLWLYLYKEAEMLGHGGRLGPLGSLIVADTLLGLVVHDWKSFWNAAPTRANWHPKEGVQPDGVVLKDFPSMLEAAGLL